MSLIGDKHQLLRLSTDRSEIMNYHYAEMMNDIARTTNAQGVPDTFQTEYKENLRDLQDAWGSGNAANNILLLIKINSLPLVLRNILPLKRFV